MALATTLVIEGCGQAEVTGAAKGNSIGGAGIHPTITPGPNATKKKKVLSGPPMSMQVAPSGGNLLTPGSKAGGN